MTDGAVDPDLPLPADLPALDRELGSPDFPLRRPLSARAPFTVRGRDALAEVRLDGGLRVRLHDRWTLTGLDVHDATPESGTGTPLGIERRLRVGDIPVIERVVVPRTGALCFLEWRADRSAVLSLSWSVEPGPGRRWRTDDRVLVIEAPTGRYLYVLSAPGAWSVGPRREGDGPADGPDGGADADAPESGASGGLAVTVTVRIPAGGSVRLAVAAGAADREPRLLRMMGRTQLAVPARRAEALRVREQGLVIRTGDPALDEALEWETARAAGLTGGSGVRPSGRSGRGREPGSSAVSEALLALVSGEQVRAREALAALGEGGDADPARWPAYLFVVGRYLAWTGDQGAVRREWGRIGRAVDASLERVGASERGGPSTGARCRELALRGMVVVAEEMGDRERAERLKAAVGGPEAGDAVGCWPASEDEAALVAVVHGLLGVEPDAPRGRLVLRPRPAPDAERLEVRGLGVGSAAVALDYRREGGTHRFALRQSRGASPLQVVLEPELVGTRLRSARVDGEPAELDPVPADGRLRIPVQLVLDHERRVVVELDGVAR